MLLNFRMEMELKQNRKQNKNIVSKSKWRSKQLISTPFFFFFIYFLEKKYTDSHTRQKFCIIFCFFVRGVRLLHTWATSRVYSPQVADTVLTVNILNIFVGPNQRNSCWNPLLNSKFQTANQGHARWSWFPCAACLLHTWVTSQVYSLQVIDTGLIATLLSDDPWLNKGFL